jgi:hypothetical protein
LTAIKESLDTDLKSAQEKAELAQAQAVDADFEHNEKRKKQALASAEKLEKKVAKKKEEKAEMSTVKPKATSKDMSKALHEISGQATVKEHTHAKILKHLVEPLEKLVASEGKDADGQDLGIDIGQAKLILHFWNEGVLKGATDVVKLLKDYAPKAP